MGREFMKKLHPSIAGFLTLSLLLGVAVLLPVALSLSFLLPCMLMLPLANATCYLAVAHVVSLPILAVLEAICDSKEGEIGKSFMKKA